MSDDLVDRLQETSATRASATAHDDPQNYLLVVARLSHEDAALMAEAAARIAELEAEVARFRWQPIETAPKDGTELLLLDKADQPWIGFWNKRTSMWDDGDFRDNLKGLTNWMPLPSISAE